jgi:hypothetical protein
MEEVLYYLYERRPLRQMRSGPIAAHIGIILNGNRRNRRLSRDYEYQVQTSEAMIDLASIRLMSNRIASA